MNTFWLIIAIIGIAFCILSAYSCCAVAARADEELERQYRELLTSMEANKKKFSTKE